MLCGVCVVSLGAHVQELLELFFEWLASVGRLLDVHLTCDTALFPLYSVCIFLLS